MISKEGIHLISPMYFDYCQKNSDVLEMLLSLGRIDIIYDCFAKQSAIVMEDL